MISVENLSFVYEGAERRALDGVSLRIPRGAFAGVTGASGSGKSTLLRAIAGIVPHYLRGRFFGAVKVGGLDTLENSPQQIARLAGFVGEDIESQMVCETVEEELLFGLENFAVPRAEIEGRIASALEMLSISHLRGRKISSLSGGQRQKTALAAMLALSPQVLILDNPSAELDPAATENLYSALAALNARGMTVVAAEQKVGLLCRFATQMIVMAEGGAALCGTTRQVMNETETLASAGVMLPRRIELGARLRAEGLYDGDMPLDIPRAAAMVRGISQ
ncbi:ABC transporter ATP-binding protein [Cloacibacillus porcorum]|uniref:energy-coupling factor ABC transporter ATP-binding protein n=1 Tax=Cloacibacillus porcorum TaxID=1197717 RepID=UPI001459714E|nr:ABC transporter ATP-binding protein [Cloacibacillus porcorum]MCC8184017.1 energy-coupling factor ABC transporter ATP-binding protein [Cloacibacillus porcorum]MDY5390647.1 ABC transporter ATP-binding protein [Cloacibacillus porcorum]NMF16706.1 ABC transporter ATP-binding protein [Cloacibacillus porcorum]